MTESAQAAGAPRADAAARRPGTGSGLPGPVWLPEAAAGAGALALYSATVAPGLTAGDSGELAAAAALWGLAHPPGYPLWTVLAHGWQAALAPLGFAPVQATNLLSAVLAAAAAALLARSLRRWTGSGAAALAAALAFAASGPIWSAAVVTEVHGLALLLLVAFLGVMGAGPAARAGRGRLLAAGLLGGWGLLAHQLFVLPWLAALPWLARAVRAGGGAGAAWTRRLGYLAAGLGLGLLPALLVWWRAAAAPDLRWGWRGPADLARYFLRTVYEPGTGAGSWAAAPARAWLLLSGLARGASAAGCLLALAGWGLAARPRGRRRAGRPREGQPKEECSGRGRPGAGWPGAGVAAGTAALAIALLPLLAPFTPDAAGLARVEPFLFVALPGLACGWAAALAGGLAAARRAGRGAFAGAVALLLPAALIWNGWPYHDRSRDVAATLYADDLLRGVPAGGVLVVEGDNEAFPLLYRQVVDGRRPDVTVRHRRGCVFRDGPDLYRLAPAEREAAVRAAESAWLRGAVATRPVVYASWVALPPEAGAALEPWGIAYRALPLAAAGGAASAGRAGSAAAVAVGPAPSFASGPAAAVAAPAPSPAAPGDPLPCLALRPRGEGARYLDHLTRRLLLAYPAAAAREAGRRRDLPRLLAAARAVAAYAWDMPDLRPPPAAAPAPARGPAVRP